MSTSNEHWKNCTTLRVIQQFPVRKCPETEKLKQIFSRLQNKKYVSLRNSSASKKPDYVILHVSTNDAPCKAGSDISNEILELMRHIKEKHPDCKKITFLHQ